MLWRGSEPDVYLTSDNMARATLHRDATEDYGGVPRMGNLDTKRPRVFIAALP
jgi:hypothetical protein